MTVELVFDCLGGAPERYAASPTLTFRLRIAELTGARLHSIALRCQIRIQPKQRRYSAEEAERLHDLFGEAPRWADTMHPLQFATVTTHVPGFQGSTQVDVQVPCSYDLEVAAGRYFDALADGEIPMLLLFSGTIFYRDDGGGLAVGQVPWHKDTTYRLPVTAWRELIDLYFPNSGWIRLPRDTVAALCRFKSQQAVAGVLEAISMLLVRAGQDRP
jgi:hypothetical protein